MAGDFSAATILISIGILVMSGVLKSDFGLPSETEPGIIHLHKPSSPVPAIHSISKIEFPFRLKSDPTTLESDEADLAILLFQPNQTDFVQVAWIVRNSQIPGLEPINTDSENAESEMGSTKRINSMLQVYDVPFPKTDSQKHQKTLGLKSRYRGAEKISGKLHLLSISKFTDPYPSLAFLYYITANESFIFFSKLVEIPGTGSMEKPVDIESVKCKNVLEGGATEFQDGFSCGCVNFVSSNDESCTHEGSPLISRRYKMPGNMWINRYYYSARKKFLYWRPMDDKVFRLIPSTDVGDSESPNYSDSEFMTVFKSQLKYAGPEIDSRKVEESGYKSLALVELFASNEQQTVLDIRIKSLNDNHFWFKVSLNHRGSRESEWTSTTLIKSFESLTTSIEGITIDLDDYFFITNPVVITSRDGATTAFLFKGILHVLDYVGPHNLLNGVAHGFALTKAKLVKALQSNIRMRGGVINDDRLTMALVTDTDSVVVIKRDFIFREIIPLGEDTNNEPISDHPSVFQVPHEISFLFDSSFNPSPIENRRRTRPHSTQSTSLREGIEKDSWELSMLWNSEFFNERDVKEGSIVSVAFVPETFDKTSGGDLPRVLLALLWSNDILIVLNLSEVERKSFLITFLLEKWKMFAVMGLAVGWFVLGEMRFAARHAQLEAQFLHVNPPDQ